MIGVFLARARRAIGSSLVAGVLAAGVSACSTDLTVLGASRSQITGSVIVQRSPVRTGHAVRAELVVRNGSGHPIVLWQGCSFQFVQLVLSRGSVSTGSAWALPLCRPGVKFVARPGTTIFHLLTPAAYRVCTPAGVPQCGRPGKGMPGLPPGIYKVTVAALSPRLRHELASVQPGRVRVMSRSSR